MITDHNAGLVKSKDKADKLRTQGNKFYIEKKFFDALLKYNESLCLAENGSETMGLTYANRSAVYFELKLYKRSLKNIELARTNGYPDKNVTILDARAQKCFEKIDAGAEAEKSTDSFDFIKLAHESHPKLPTISNCLKLRINKKFGRYIITNQELRVGDIVAIEQPHFKILKSDSRYDCCEDTNKYQRCAFCLKGNLLDLIPCENCSSTMFCSDKCSSDAKKAFHDYECPMIETLLTSGVMQMSTRIFFQSLAMFNGSIEDMEKFFNANEDTSATVYNCDATDSNDEMAAKNNLILLLCLARNDNNYGSDSPEKLFKKHPKLSQMWQSNELFIRKFILRTLQIGDSNFHGICGWSVSKSASQTPQMIGIGCYPFMSLLNHSCAPNINRIYVDDKMLLLVERPVRKGEQIFDCYKHTFFTQSKIERQPLLRSSYGFACDCIACKDDFPLYNRLMKMDKSIFETAQKGRQELVTMSKVEAEKRFIEYCQISQNHHDNGFPSKEIVLLQECILECLSIVIKSIKSMPFNCRRVVKIFCKI